ncbi:MAG: hypothetical protein ACRD2I_12945 [Vicinamibacterales bacterium]
MNVHEFGIRHGQAKIIKGWRDVRPVTCRDTKTLGTIEATLIEQ